MCHVTLDFPSHVLRIKKQKEVTRLVFVCGVFFRYKENAMELSNRFHDRPTSAQETVAYWTEYVLRHDGAHHLKSQAVNTHWFQYFSLDFLVLAAVIVTSLFYFLYNVLSVVRINRGLFFLLCAHAVIIIIVFC